MVSPWVAPSIGEHMFVLGIDPGLTRTGYGVLSEDHGSIETVAAGVIRTESGAAIEERLMELYRDLQTVIREHTPTEVAIERVFVNQNLRSAVSVVQAAGVTLLAVGEAGLRAIEYTPSAVKMALAGYGRADKAQVQRIVARRLSLDVLPEPADAADALAIALCHVQTSCLQRRIEHAT